MEKIIRFLNHINNDEMQAILNIQNVLLYEMQNFAFKEGFKQIMPILMSPITDPLNHEVYPAEISYEDRPLRLTASMIFHKQLTLMQNSTDKILIMAPNIRLELASKKSSKSHLLEFSQFDIEMKQATMDDVMSFLERFYIYIFNQIEIQSADDLRVLGRKLPKITKPFPRYSTEGMPLDKVDDFCNEVSKKTEVPAFITNFKREFYDKEELNKRGVYRNFDIVYPEGYGEGLSGAEREYQYDEIVRKMKERNMDLAPYANYLKVAELGLLPATAGCGRGIQRLLRYICGQPLISDVCLFDRSIQSEFVF
ncbi:MAG: asparagine synthetase A [Gammaproteobacteria bacterium]